MEPYKALLNLNTVLLVGFEQQKGFLGVASYVAAIEAGDKLPPVHVVEITSRPMRVKLKEGYTKRFNGIYELMFSREMDHPWKGGHRRSVAHYLANKPLEVLVHREHLDTPFSSTPIWRVDLSENDLGEYSQGFRKAMKTNRPFRLLDDIKDYL